jgi:arylsulfatase
VEGAFDQEEWMSKPNIIFIYSDQHRGDALGCAGHPAIKTPNLDRLASDGTMFTQCYTNGPVCMPARATMMTGQYVREHGVWQNIVEAPPTGPSHVRNIRDAGYHTALVGKTHLYVHGGGSSQSKQEILREWGFVDTQELHGPHASGTNQSQYSDYLEELGLWETHRDYVVLSKTRLEEGNARAWEDPACPLPSESHLDSYAGRTAAEWVRDYNGEKPFYLQVLFPGPHNPFDSPQADRDLYDMDDIPEGIMDLPEEPHYRHIQRALYRSGDAKTMTTEEKKQLVINYYAKITLIDRAIAGILNALKGRGAADNTWVIYNSDHGEMAGDHRLSHKAVFYDAAVRVPLIVRPPGGQSGWTSRGLTDCLNITASMLDIAGAEPLSGSDGSSFVQQVLNGGGADGAQNGKVAVFSEVDGLTMIFDGRYKLVVESDTEEPVEMYDCENDPSELSNVFDDPDLMSIRAGLIDRHLSRIRDRLDREKLETYHKLASQDKRQRPGA